MLLGQADFLKRGKELNHFGVKGVQRFFNESDLLLIEFVLTDYPLVFLCGETFDSRYPQKEQKYPLRNYPPINS